MDHKKLTREQVAALRGRLKAPKRGIAMQKRTASRQEKAELDYQNQLAKDMRKYL